MAETIELKVEPRNKVGKGAARAARRKGLVPGVIYGDKKPPEPITIERRLLWKYVQTGGFLSTVFILDLGGKKIQAIPRDVHFDPVKDLPIHVDFLRLAKGAGVTVEVHVNFLNEENCPGVKRGGALNIVRHEIEVNCPADAIPEQIDVDLSGLDIGDSIHISDITLPDKVTPAITDRDFTIVTVVGSAAGEAAAKESEDGGDEDGKDE